MSNQTLWESAAQSLVKLALSPSAISKAVRTAATKADPARVQRFADAMHARSALQQAGGNTGLASKLRYAAGVAQKHTPTNVAAFAPSAGAVGDQVIHQGEQAFLQNQRKVLATNAAGLTRQKAQLGQAMSPARDMLAETPMVRGGMGVDSAFAMTGNNQMNSQRALMDQWHGPRASSSELAGIMGGAEHHLALPVSSSIPDSQRLAKLSSEHRGLTKVGSLLEQVGHSKVRATSAAPPNPQLAVKHAWNAAGAWHGFNEALLPAIGGLAGSTIGGGMGVDPLTGEILGAAGGAVANLGVGAIQARRGLAPHGAHGVHVAPAAHAAVAPVTAKVAFTESQFSGGTGGGTLNYRDYLALPQATSVAPPPSFSTRPAKVEEHQSELKLSSVMRRAINALGEQQKSAAVSSAKGQLSTSQHVGAPRTTAPPGPSISQVSKPVGYGRALPGTTKAA